MSRYKFHTEILYIYAYILKHRHISSGMNILYIPMHDIAYVLAFQCTKLKQYTVSIIIYIRGHTKKNKKTICINTNVHRYYKKNQNKSKN